MNDYKNILVFGCEEIRQILAHIINSPGMQSIEASDEADFLVKLSDIPDAIILDYTITDKYSIASLHTSDIPVAFIVNPSDHDFLVTLLNLGFTTLISEDNMKTSLQPFLSSILLLDKKSNILLKAFNRLKNLANNATEGIIIMDDNRRVSYANDAAEKILKIHKSKLMQKSISEIFSEHPFTVDCMSEEPIFIENHEFVTVNGKRIFMNSTCSANYEKGLFAGAVLLFTKISTSAMDHQMEFDLLKFQQRYHSIQQTMAFKKQMLILKDEVSNVIAGNFSVETYFKPLDILSGDIYGSINIKDGRYLFYIIDAMGKGLSASVTALQSSSFINHSLEMSILKNDFDLNKTIASFLHYIRDRLMEEEALCVAFVLLDTNNNTLSIANYGMPPVYLVNDNGDIDVNRPNNLPIMRCIADRNTSVHSLDNIDKIIIMSDGLIESSTNTGGLYIDHLHEHLNEAITKKHMLSLVNKCINSNEDDITFFFLKKMALGSADVSHISIQTSLDHILETSQQVCALMEQDNVNKSDRDTIEYALSEILMNALEHGNLGIGFKEKQELIANGNYDDYLNNNTQPDSENFNKKITIKYHSSQHLPNGKRVISISINDEGRGFAPANLFKYHSFDGNLCHVDNTSYNGRGIFITDSLVDGLYYNEKGNCAYIIKIIDA